VIGKDYASNVISYTINKKEEGNKTMETKENIYQKLDRARKIIRETALKKDGHNTYSKYDYFTPEAVEKLVADACEKTGTICVTNLKADTNGLFQVLEFVDVENPTERIQFEIRTAEADMTATNRAQKMGGTDTYSERYAKQKAFQIKDNNLDFDSQDNTPKQDISRKLVPPSYPKRPVAPAKRTDRYENAKQSAELSAESADNDF
jgi:hypothetical protein